MTVLAIDQGTSATKAVVVSDDGRVLAVAEESLSPTYQHDGGVTQDPHALLESVLLAGRRAVAAAGVPVRAVGLANQGESVLAWDRASGEPLSDVIVWQDRRAAAVCAELAKHSDYLAARTGLTLNPYFSAPKMTWLRRHITTEGVVTTTDTWLLARLCGAFVTDTATASRSLVADLDTTAWDLDLLEIFELQNEELPELVPADAVIGETTAFGPTMVVAGLLLDQPAALLAQSAVHPGDLKCTYGTGAFLLSNLGPTPKHLPGLTTSVAWDLRDTPTYCADGQVPTVASAVRWLISIGLLSGADEIDLLATGDTGGVVCVPTFAGAAAPTWDPRATASFGGMTLSTTRDHLVQSLVEGISAQVALLLRLPELGVTADRPLRVDGGLTRSRALMQAQADVAQRPIEVFPSPHATPLGVAMATGLALDRSGGVEDVVGGWEPSDVFVPRWSADRADDFLERWQNQAVALSGGA